MAGLGAKLFTAFSKLTAAQVNGYLMDQTIMRFATSAARDAAFGGAGEPTLAEGMTCYLDDTNEIQSYNGTAWVGVAASSTVAGVSSGLVYVAGGPLATATTTFQGCFSSKYRNYRIIIDSFSVSASSWAYIQYLSGATPNATNNYTSSGTGLSSNGSTATRVVASGNEGYLTFTDSASLTTSMQFDISTPFISQRTFLQGNAMSYQSAFAWSSQNFFVLQNQNTVFDGFQIASLGVPTLTGNVAIYGYTIA